MPREGAVILAEDITEAHHTTPEEAGEVFSRVNRDSLVYAHMTDPNVDCRETAAADA